MTAEEAQRLIEAALTNTLGRQSPECTPSTDLIQDEVLDSLDSVVFVLQLGQLSGRDFSEREVASPGFFRVDNLIGCLTEN